MNDEQFEIGDYIKLDARIDPSYKFGKVVQKLSVTGEFVVEIIGSGVRKSAKLNSSNLLLTNEDNLVNLKFKRMNKSGFEIKKGSSNNKAFFLKYEEGGCLVEVSKLEYKSKARAKSSNGPLHFNSEYCLTNFQLVRLSEFEPILVMQGEAGPALNEAAFYQKYGSAKNLNAVLKKINFEGWSESLHEVLS